MSREGGFLINRITTEKHPFLPTSWANGTSGDIFFFFERSEIDQQKHLKNPTEVVVAVEYMPSLPFFGGPGPK